MSVVDRRVFVAVQLPPPPPTSNLLINNLRRATLTGSVVVYLVFAVVFFLPDISFAGYLAGPRIGATLYNFAQLRGALVLAATTVRLGTGLSLALVWAAHIGFDRALGYGLKHSTAFRDTHLGRIGRGPV